MKLTPCPWLVETSESWWSHLSNSNLLGCRWEAPSVSAVFQRKTLVNKSQIRCSSEETNLWTSLVDGLSWWVRLSSGSLSGSNRGLSGGRNLSCGRPGLAAGSGKGGCRVRPGCSKRVMSKGLLIIQSILPSPKWTVLLSARQIGPHSFIIHLLDLWSILGRGGGYRKPRSYASPKLCPLNHWLTDLLTGVKCRATSVAKKWFFL